MSERTFIYIDIDGILPEVLYETLDAPGSALGSVARTGLRVERAVTVFPSVTYCCQASMFTGVFPNRHGILGNSIFDRTVSPPVFRIYVTAGVAASCYDYDLFGWPTGLLPSRPGKQLVQNDVTPGIRTVYEFAKDKGLTSWQAFNQYPRGTDVWIRPTRPMMLLFALCHEEKLNNRYWDASNFRRLTKYIRKRPLPDILTFYISGHDNNSHEKGPGDQRNYFRTVVDPMFGRLFKTLEKVRPLDTFYFMISADHSQAATKRDMDAVITRERLGEMLSTVEGGGFRLAGKNGPVEGDTAVACMEAGVVQFHLMNRATGKWRDPARFEEDVLPAAKVFDPYREGDPHFVDQILVRRTVEEGYLAWENGALVPLETFYAGKEKDYPDAVRRIRGLNSPKTGDLLVLNRYRDGLLFGDSLKAGEHGSLHAADSLVPFVVAGPGIGSRTVATASIVDLVPTAGAVMGFPTPGVDGVSVI